jgi:hypothetical protein
MYIVQNRQFYLAITRYYLCKGYIKANNQYDEKSDVKEKLFAHACKVRTSED